jgi:hypothetical protein
MNSKHRSTRNPRVILLVLCAFVAGLVLALWAPGRNAPRIVGALGVAAGLVLLLVRNPFTRDPDAPPTEQQIAAEHQARTGMRTVGASVVLMGMAEFIPDIQMRTVVILCGAAVSMAGVLKVPRRLFAPKGSTR